MAEEKTDFIITAIDKATRVLQGVGKGFEGLQKSYNSLQAVLGVAAVTIGIQKIVSATVDAERASARLDSALKATGSAAGLTRAELDQMAESLKRSSPFDDDEIRKGIASLLRFRDVQGDVFRQAARLAPDLATALDTDLVGAFTRLGRALEDPEKGLRALREAGLDVTSAQEQVNRVMKETGDVSKAQKIILDDLTKSVGGAAAGENAGLYGSLKGVEKAWGDVLKGLGQNEVAMQRMIRTARMLEGALKAVGAIPEEGERKGPTREQRDIAAQGQAAQDSARLIEQYQAIVDKETERVQRETAEREKRLRDDDVKGWVAYADQVFEEADQMNLALAKISEEHWEREEKLKQEDIKGWVAYAEQVFEEADEVNRALARLAEQDSEKARKAAERLGMTFASAFEDAIVKLNSLRDILRGLAQDILRIFVRMQVTEPLAGFFTTLFSGGGGVDVNAITPSASGGHRRAGQMLLVGERGPELFMPDRAGTVIPNHAMGGGTTLVQNIHFSANTPAAVRDAVFAAAPMIADATIARLNDQRLRGSRV